MKIENNLRDLNQIIPLDSIVCSEKVRRNTNYAKLTTLNTTLQLSVMNSLNILIKSEVTEASKPN